jgi:pimeloyl-ACP methyl ester carboxylesterase
MQKPPPEYSLKLLFHPELDDSYVHFENSAAHPFQSDPAGFPRVNAWWLADCALLSYRDNGPASTVFASAGLESTFVTEGSADCYVAWRNDYVIVAFRGAEFDEWEDIVAPAKFDLVPWLAGNVHRGFKDAFEAVWPKLEDAVAAVSGGRKIWFCGHSLGAAMATLAAYRHPDARGICTFGSPRVGDAAFAAAFASKLPDASLRYVNHNDVVTHLPPPLFGHCHLKEPRFIALDGSISGDPPPLVHFFSELIGQPEHLLEMIERLLDGSLTVAPKFLLDHMPKAYAIWIWNDFDSHR